jgi:tetratricopeptide (TPR) repeat protein
LRFYSVYQHIWSRILTSQKRKRGIKASRTRLDTAMLNAGYKSQASIAEQMAANEGLSVAPKDLVNRAFRQENVSPATIARIAHVLKVEARELYLSDEEQQTLEQRPSPITEKSHPQANRATKISEGSGKYRLLMFATIIIGAILTSLYSVVHNWDSTSSAVEQQANKYKHLEKLTFVIRNTSKTFPSVLPVIEQTINQLQTSHAIFISQDSEYPMSVDIAERYQADVVLTIRTVRFGRHIGSQYFLFTHGREFLFWTDQMTVVERRKAAKVAALSALRELNWALDPQNINLINPRLISLSAQTKYLKARRLLDEHQSEINLRRAEDLLDSAIKQHANFAEAYAAKCEAQLRLSWMGDEGSILEDARESCEKANSIDSTSPYARSSHAFLLRRTGRIAESIEKYQEVLTQFPNNVTALAGLSSSALEAFRQALPDLPNALQLSRSSAEKAARLEPQFWLHHSTLANIYFLSNDLDNAIASAKMTASLNPNELSLVNLGFFNLCKGSFKAARDSFDRAKTIAPDSYLGSEYLGLAHYFLKDFSESARLRKSALDKINIDSEAAIHQMWGNLADSYRHIGQISDSKRAYQKAIDTVDRDILRGNDAIVDRVYRLYYSIQLGILDSDKRSPSQTAKMKQQLTQYSNTELDSSGLIKLAQIFKLLGRTEQMRATLEKATHTCPGFADYPDIKSTHINN